MGLTSPRKTGRLEPWYGWRDGLAWHTYRAERSNKSWICASHLLESDCCSISQGPLELYYINIHTFKQQSSILGKHLSYGPVAQRTPDHLPPGAQTTSRVEHTLRSPMHVFCHFWSDLYISYACYIPTSNRNINMLLYIPDSFQQKNTFPGSVQALSLILCV